MSLGGNKHEFKDSFFRIAVLHLIVRCSGLGRRGGRHLGHRWGQVAVEIAPCGLKFCGSIVRLKEPLDDDGKLKHDANNPNKILRNRSIIGLPLLANFVASTEGNVWEDGTIYNPEDGKTYSCTLTLLDTETLKVRGYVGLPMFGKTQIWKRVN